MKVFAINYDLKQPGQRYAMLIEAIKSYGTYWHVQGSLWIIASSRSAPEVRDHLRAFIDANDSLVVSRIVEAAWYGLPQQGSAWLKKLLESKQAA